MATSDVTTITAVSDILLQENDLPPKDEDYLTLMSPNDYVGKYGDLPKVVDNGRRLFIVLPLHVVDAYGINKFIPIPFIVDTGAPETIYLGTGARNILKDNQFLHEPMALRQCYQLIGIFYNGEEILNRPVAVIVPKHYEDTLFGDVRINFLGKKGMKALKVNIEWTKVLDLNP